MLGLIQRLSGALVAVLLSQRLLYASAGNSVFVAETLRHWVERGLLAADAAGQWSTPFDECTQDYAELPVPGSVYATVLERVKRTNAGCQRVLEAAAPAGEPFGPALLAPACALSELDAVLAIEAAAQAQLLREHDAGGYAFVHDLVQQAIDSALPPGRRRLVHRRLALHLPMLPALRALARVDAQRNQGECLLQLARDLALTLAERVEAVTGAAVNLTQSAGAAKALVALDTLPPGLPQAEQRQVDAARAGALSELGRTGGNRPTSTIIA